MVTKKTDHKTNSRYKKEFGKVLLDLHHSEIFCLAASHLICTGCSRSSNSRSFLFLMIKLLIFIRFTIQLSNRKMQSEGMNLLTVMNNGKKNI